MSSIAKRFQKLRDSPTNLRFGEFVSVIEAFGFSLARIAGSHYIFEREDVAQSVNVQNKQGKAKAYQVRQFLALVARYNLTLEDR